MLNVWLYQNTLTSKDLDERLPTLPQVVQQRIQRRKRLESRLQSLAGYALLQKVLSEKGIDMEQLRFSAVGKPFIANSTFTFSNSHNAGWVGLCWATMGRVGLDLQAYRTFEPIESAFSFFSTAEQQAILNSTQPQQTLIHYWAKKEALIKAGNGRMFDEAAQTNATLQNCIWKDVAYYWSPIATDFEGAIWAASDFEPQKIIVKKCRSI